MPCSETPGSKKPVSDQQLSRHPAIAALPTAPSTPEHGSRRFSAADYAVVRLDAAEDLANLRADLVAVYWPVNSQELIAVGRMALAQHAIFRTARLEAGLFTSCLSETLDDYDRPFTPMNPELIGGVEVTRAQLRPRRRISPRCARRQLLDAAPALHPCLFATKPLPQDGRMRSASALPRRSGIASGPPVRLLD